jgi:hypothetical protein
VKEVAMQYWLQCTVAPGQFSGEYAVAGRQTNGSDFSLFAPAEVVAVDAPPREGETTPGWLRVQVYDQSGAHYIVRLPAPPLQGGQYVTVSGSQLQRDPAAASRHDPQ